MSGEASRLNPSVVAIDQQVAHLWMVRTFLKHADESEDDEELRSVVRDIYDFILAVGPVDEVDDDAVYLKMAKKKLTKLRKATELYEEIQPEVSGHTNFRNGSQSRCVSPLTPSPKSSSRRRRKATREIEFGPFLTKRNQRSARSIQHRLSSALFQPGANTLATPKAKTKDFIDPTFLFRFEIEIRKADRWTGPSKGLTLAGSVSVAIVRRTWRQKGLFGRTGRLVRGGDRHSSHGQRQTAGALVPGNASR